MMFVDVNPRQLAKLKKALGNAKKKLPREVSVAMNATAKKMKGEINNEIRKELAVKKATVAKTLNQREKATAKDLRATITLKETARIPLKEFGARQTKKGVSYKVSKSRGRKFVKSAFQGPKPGAMKASWKGNVFKRVGKPRLPIVKLFGVSPWGVFVVNAMKKPALKKANVELKKQIDRRIRFIKLKASGKI